MLWFLKLMLKQIMIWIIYKNNIINEINRNLKIFAKTLTYLLILTILIINNSSHNIILDSFYIINICKKINITYQFEMT